MQSNSALFLHLKSTYMGWINKLWKQKGSQLSSSVLGFNKNLPLTKNCCFCSHI